MICLLLQVMMSYQENKQPNSLLNVHAATHRHNNKTQK